MATNVSRIYPLILLPLFMLFSHSISLSPNGEQSKPFEFLKYFHGTHKGDKVKRLEKSIKTYELNYHLSSTGTLDAATLTKMMMPRCSVPDINNGKTSMRSWKKNHVHGSGSSFIHTVGIGGKVCKAAKAGGLNSPVFNPCGKDAVYDGEGYPESNQDKVLEPWHLAVEKNRTLLIKLYPEISNLTRDSPPIASFIIRVVCSVGDGKSLIHPEITDKKLKNNDDFVWAIEVPLTGKFIIDIEFLDLKIVPLEAVNGSLSSYYSNGRNGMRNIFLHHMQA
ncbi:hypothetical protein TEA_005511 [Camellia sinensis var. sinensis]|uniref:Uncharacterized protein n=1 Tax=Camellia sinensis var. sinensis TaxID=542762 RepID=A0A4S4DZ17_CAMSN|nr:hypothetical protein TEA_005511 [Camellia sinensis var. sinensis]